MLLFSHEADSDLLFEIRMAAAVPPPTDSKAALKYAFSANFELGWRRQCRRRQIAKELHGQAMIYIIALVFFGVAFLHSRNIVRRCFPYLFTAGHWATRSSTGARPPDRCRSPQHGDSKSRSNGSDRPTHRLRWPRRRRGRGPDRSWPIGVASLDGLCASQLLASPAHACPCLTILVGLGHVTSFLPIFS